MRTRRHSNERYILAIALLIPIGVSLFLAAELMGVNIRFGFPTAYAAAGTSSIVMRRPAASQAAPPPTLAPAPTATPAPAESRAAPSPTAAKNLTYTVQPGDELKHIAAEYGVNIFKIIEANDIPNPDSLRVGQVLRIPN